MKAGQKRSGERKYRSERQTILYGFIMMSVIIALLFGFISWLRSTPEPYRRENTEFYGLPTASHRPVNASEQVMIDDKSAYAKDAALVLSQFTRYFYDNDMLIAKADYDESGSLFQWTTWEYDTAGNIRIEQTENEADGVQKYSHIYEYDDSGRVVHEEIYQDKDLMENHYLRYTDTGCAGVSYSYIDERSEGGISDYCSSHTEFVEDEEGKPLCVFKLDVLNSQRPYEAQKIQWTQQGSRIANRVRIYTDSYKYSLYYLYWYESMEHADAEQVNLYGYNPVTGETGRTLQLNYEWQDGKDGFALMPTFYHAGYGGGIWWQLIYTDGRLSYYGVCEYDSVGHMVTVIEYDTEGKKPYTRLYRYEYPDGNSAEEYIYAVQGEEFSHLFESGESVRLTFSADDILCGIEMTDVSGNILEKYEFSQLSRNYGKLQKMYTDADVVTGEDAILKKLEEEAALWTFLLDKADIIEEGAK
ncbi:MAG: hypothetical protein NC231_14675 [Bacillus sp. (in: Bacteria)]|nr:hypothetical protein [Bacillus sp. (in: firmicutes)]